MTAFGEIVDELAAQVCDYHDSVGWADGVDSLAEAIKAAEGERFRIDHDQPTGEHWRIRVEAPTGHRLATDITADELEAWKERRAELFAAKATGLAHIMLPHVGLKPSAGFEGYRMVDGELVPDERTDLA